MTYEWRPPGQAQVRDAPTITHVLYDFDGPKLVLAIDEDHCQLIGVAADEDEEESTTRWVFASARPEDVLKLIEGTIGLGKLFSGGELVEVWDILQGWVSKRSYTLPYAEVPSRLLPAADAALPELTKDALLELDRSQHERLREQGKLARVRLFFDGSPIRGRRAVAATFASDALSSYQSLVAMAYGMRHKGGLSPTGPIPARGQSSLYLTGMPRGSVGFELVEILEQRADAESGLCDVVADVHDLLAAASESDARYADAVSGLGVRVNKALEVFLNVLRKADATLRIESRMQRYVFSKQDINGALQRASHVPPDEEVRGVDGMLIGILPVDLRFELVLEEDGRPGRIIKGKVDRGADLEKITSVMRKPCRLQLLVVKVQESEAFVLLDADPAEASR